MEWPELPQKPQTRSLRLDCPLAERAVIQVERSEEISVLTGAEDGIGAARVDGVSVACARGFAFVVG